MENTLKLRIISILSLFVASFCGICTPLLYGNTLNPILLHFLNAVATGILLGLALMHLAADAAATFDLYNLNYPISYLLIGFGVFLCQALEQVASNMTKTQTEITSSDMESHNEELIEFDHHHSHHQLSSYGAVSLKDDGCESDVTSVDNEADTPTHPSSSTPFSPTHIQHNHHNAQQNNVQVKEAVFLFLLELTTSLHSLIIGANLGMISQSDQLIALFAYLFALLFHQFVEGLGMGAVLFKQHARAEQQWRLETKVFVALFSCSTSIGVIIGTLMSSSSSSSSAVRKEEEELIRAGASAISAGCILFIGLTKMLPALFTSTTSSLHSHHHSHSLLTQESRKSVSTSNNDGSTFAGLLLGFMSMALLAIWA